MKNRLNLTESDLNRFHDTDPVPQAVAYSLRAPVPQVLLVTRDPQTAQGLVSVRTNLFNPLTWQPLTMSVNIPKDETSAVRNLSAPGARCVLGLPSRHLLRELTICSQQLPIGISEADVARLRLCKSAYVDVPSIDDCPVNLECTVVHLEPYHSHVIAFLRCVGANIDLATLFMAHQDALGSYPTYLVDEVVDETGAVRQRVGIQSELFDCPTFPVGPKRGWYANFGIWMRELADENYLRPEEFAIVMSWHERWLQLFGELGSPERALLRRRLTDMLLLVARQRWDELHDFMAKERAAVT